MNFLVSLAVPLTVGIHPVQMQVQRILGPIVNPTHDPEKQWTSNIVLITPEELYVSDSGSSGKWLKRTQTPFTTGNWIIPLANITGILPLP